MHWPSSSFRKDNFGILLGLVSRNHINAPFLVAMTTTAIISKGNTELLTARQLQKSPKHILNKTINLEMMPPLF
jgi:hypothetical protein